jgi:hypothetical protein
MLENLSYKNVIGSSAAPYQNSLASQCGSATAMFGTTHSSAANYLALSAGRYPASSPPGCGSVKTCSDASDNLYHQLDTAGLTWRNYEESMPAACSTTSGGSYKIGHNPALFYTDIPRSECVAKDLAVPDLAAQSGTLWNDLNNQTLPSFSWVTPNLNNDGSGGETPADSWLRKFMATVQASASYQAGNTLVLVTYDEGKGGDDVTGEDCTNQSRDMPVINATSAHQDSCHIPLFVAYPFTPAGVTDGTFLDHYSITKTVEELFGLPLLAHAADSQTSDLFGHFGIALPSSAPPDTTPPDVAISSPTDASAQSGSIVLVATASDDVAVDHVAFYVDGTLIANSVSSPYTATLDTTTLTNATHSLTAVASDTAGNSQSSAPVSIAVTNIPDTTPPTVTLTSPASDSTLSGSIALAAAASDDVGVTGVSFYADSTLISTSSASPYAATLDSTTLSNGSHQLSAVATDANGNSQTSSLNVTVSNAAPSTACPAVPTGMDEYSANPSLESNQTGWTGVYNGTSVVRRTQLQGGSYDGAWALSTAPKSGTTGTAGVNNAAPFWIPGAPGVGTIVGRAYTGRVMVKASVAGESIHLLVRETTASGSGVGSAVASLTPDDTSWHSLSTVYRAKNAGDVIRGSIYVSNFVDSSQYFLADCLSLQAPTS